ncbi:efflux RND transporter permease subunit [Abyssibius alkaniclasticus]|uniref:efflux RND transporter permease subunit n=1 Tax=Abyssibius alkaniclasticus TaxID=2881234 RepID=UPI002363A903|nr:efflux RND transporter permease subunit [Abyssibius alkaniclasticus]UPH72601.1 efflux RND transporter permease subunit [Abyssibius alkaniclasticus]
MFLTRISVNAPVFATMIMVALMVIGVYSFQRLPIEQLPDVDFPVVAVVVSYPGASPEAVESDIVEPIEESVNTISGIDYIESTSRAGEAMVILFFDMSVDSSTAMQDVRDRMGGLSGQFPTNANDPLLFKFDPSELPVVSLAVSASTMSLRDLTALTEDVIEPRLSSIQGVGRATVVGGIPRQLNVLIDPDRLTAFGVGVGEVTAALGQENQNLPAGDIEQGLEVQSIQVEGRIENAADFLDIIVARRGGQPVRLGDVATLVDGEAEVNSLALLNGSAALAVDIVKTQGANTVGVAESIRQAVAELMADDLPEGVIVEIVRDNAVPVEDSYYGVQNMLIEGAVLAVLIVFLFLNSWRSTVITGLTLPISVIGTMTVLFFLGFTLNIMTLLALSLAIGLLIDDAIVVRENIMRHLHMGKTHRQAALDGTNEIGLAVLATTLSIVAVFLPVAFMDGIIGKFFLQFGVTVSVAVLISMFVAFTLDPMMSSVWYDPAGDPKAARGFLGRQIGRFGDAFDRLGLRYRGLLRWSLRHRVTTLVLALAAFIGSFFLVPLVGAEFAPAVDNSEFQVEVETPVGSSLAYTASKIRQIDRVLRAFPEVTGTYATINGATSSGGENAATVAVTMVSPSQRNRSPQDMTLPVRQALAQIPGIDVTIGAAGGLGGVEAPVQINLYGDNFDRLGPLAERLVRALEAIDGLEDVSSSLDAAQPVLGVRINRDAASDLGVSLQQIAATLRPMLGGQDVSDWTAPDGRSFTVTVRLPADMRNDLDVLRSLPVAQSGATGSAGMVRLDQVAEIVQSFGPSEIRRRDLSRQVLVSANISGVTLGEVMPAVQAAIDGLDLPYGYRASAGGDAEQLAETGAAAASALLLAVIFIYLVLASQFGSFLQPVAIMAALPLALIGVMLGLLVGGSTLNMFSMIGFIMLMGLVVKNAILLVDNTNQQMRDHGLNIYDALVEAGSTRFRPIIMTTLAMIFGMLPLALNLDEGSGQNAPMAHAVIGGLISSTILTLVVVPVVLTYVQSFGRSVGRLFPNGPDHGQAPQPPTQNS